MESLNQPGDVCGRMSFVIRGKKHCPCESESGTVFSKKQKKEKKNACSYCG